MLTLAGHYKGLVWVCRADRRKDLAQELWPFMAADAQEGDGATEAAEDLLARLRSSLHEEKVAKFTKLSAHNQNAAQAYLSQLLKPRESLQTRLSEENTGRQLSDSETLAAIANDVTARGNAGHAGVPAFNFLVQRCVANARAEALRSSETSPSVSVSFQLFCDLISTVQARRASVQLPRQAIVAASDAGRVLMWVLVNLIFALGIVPSSWFRIISPTRKRGPVVVTKLVNLRPVCYVSDLEGVVDLVWLHLFKQTLIEYAGSSQVGGQMDPVLVTVGILTGLQSRMNANLPSLVLKADLLQGYDLAWRDAVRLHAWQAGIHGNGWLFLDSCLAVDQARVRMGPLLGPFFVILNHGIRQGGRSAVQLFGAFARDWQMPCVSLQ